MRSAIVKASSWSCVTIMVVTPSFFCRFFISSLRYCLTFASNAESGSSRRSKPGEGASALANATRCCSPPDNCAENLFM